MYKFIIPHIKRKEIMFMVVMKCRPKSFEILQTCCKIHAFFFKTCQSILDYKKCLNNFRIFSCMQEKRNFYFIFIF